MFRPDLGGHELVDNQSHWRNFPLITNDAWVHANMVLLGDALCSVHFSIGSGTRLAMEDSIALYKAFRDVGDDVPRALARFVETRRPVVDKLLDAARNSALWYENFHQLMELDPHELVYSYMTRTGRVDDEHLRKLAPIYMDRLDAHRVGQANRGG